MLMCIFNLMLHLYIIINNNRKSKRTKTNNTQNKEQKKIVTYKEKVNTNNKSISFYFSSSSSRIFLGLFFCDRRVFQTKGLILFFFFFSVFDRYTKMLLFFLCAHYICIRYGGRLNHPI